MTLYEKLKALEEQMNNPNNKFIIGMIIARTTTTNPGTGWVLHTNTQANGTLLSNQGGSGTGHYSGEVKAHKHITSNSRFWVPTSDDIRFMTSNSLSGYSRILVYSDAGWVDINLGDLNTSNTGTPYNYAAGEKVCLFRFNGATYENGAWRTNTEEEFQALVAYNDEDIERMRLRDIEIETMRMVEEEKFKIEEEQKQKN